MVGGLLAPTTETWQSSSIFSTKFKFSFAKSNSIRRMKLRLRDNVRVNSYRGRRNLAGVLRIRCDGREHHVHGGGACSESALNEHSM